MSTKIAIVKNKHRYEMIDFYIASRKMSVCENTNETCLERLNTVFDDLTSNYNIIMKECMIVGLTGHVLQKWFNHFMDGRKPSTINNYVSFLNPFLRWAYNIGYIPDDISHILRTVKVPSVETLPEWERPKDKYLTHEDVTKLLHADFGGRNAKRDRAIVAMFLYSGIRVSELCSLTLGSVMKYPVGQVYCKRKGGKWSFVEVGMDFYDYLNDYLENRSDIEDMDAPLFRS